MNIGFDIDGTLTNERFEVFHAQATIEQPVEFYVSKMLEFTSTRYMRILQNLLHSSDRVFVISFRWQEWAETTYRWFEKQGVERDRVTWFFSPPEIHNISPEEYRRVAVDYKTKILLDNSIDVYYEDSDFLVEELRKNCPETVVIHV